MITDLLCEQIRFYEGTFAKRPFGKYLWLSMNQNNTIVLYQPLLYNVAVKILDSVADAEDIVQDTLLKWLVIDKRKIQNTKAYLIKSVTNNCFNYLDTIKRKKTECLDGVSPREMIDKHKEAELFYFDLENELDAAIGIIHKKLGTLEKGIFVLREFFDLDYEELQKTFDKTKDNCRQLFSRAKAKLDKETYRFRSELSKTGFLESFLQSYQKDDPQHLINHIKEELKGHSAG